MIADVDQLYRTLGMRLEQIVHHDVHAPTAVIEDACQVAWYRLLNRAHRVDQDAALSWLATTAVHEALKLARREEREVSLEARMEETGELNMPAKSPSPHEYAEWHEQLALVRRLPIRQRRFLLLQAVGHSYTEIACEEGATQRTVQRQILRGRNRLRVAE